MIIHEFEQYTGKDVDLKQGQTYTVVSTTVDFEVDPDGPPEGTLTFTHRVVEAMKQQRSAT